MERDATLRAQHLRARPREQLAMPTEYHEAKCPMCGKPFPQLVVTVLGQEAYRARVCQDCLPKEDDPVTWEPLIRRLTENTRSVVL